eukprot:gb/GECG01012791.1/.p1 GENE.gb/GECG01012791.1/~~gb/GECG01012791.1/.p1  ORF type:complete len:538 (+),score=33.83 gb/GECG01012791.1/:1-1614(+)
MGGSTAETNGYGDETRGVSEPLSGSQTGGTYGSVGENKPKTTEKSAFQKDQQKKRWMLAISAHTVILILGLRYTAPVWLPDIKDQLSLTQAQMSIVGFCLYAGSLVVGIPINRTLQRFFGKTAAFWIAAMCAPLGYLYLHFALVKGIKNVIPLYIISVVVGYTTGGSYITILELLTERLGNAYLPILSGSTNLCYSLGGVTGCLGYMHNHNTEKFLLALSVLHFIVWIPIGITQYLRDRVIPQDPKDSEKADGTKEIEKDAEDHEDAEVPNGYSQEYDDKKPLTSESQDKAMEGTQASIIQSYKRIGKLPSYYFVMVSMFLMYGVMTSIATNLGSMAVSLGASAEQVNQTILIMMGAQGVGRMAVLAANSFVKYHISGRTSMVPGRVPNAGLLVCIFIGTVLVIACSLGAARDWTNVQQLAGFSVVYGFVYGMMWVLSPQISQFVDTDGTLVAILLMTIFPFAGVGALVFHLIVGNLYDNYHGTSKGDNGALQCDGTGCFQAGFGVWTAGAGILLGLSVLYIFFHYKRTRDIWTAPT